MINTIYEHACDYCNRSIQLRDSKARIISPLWARNTIEIQLANGNEVWIFDACENCKLKLFPKNYKVAPEFKFQPGHGLETGDKYDFRAG